MDPRAKLPHNRNSPKGERIEVGYKEMVRNHPQQRRPLVELSLSRWESELSIQKTS